MAINPFNTKPQVNHEKIIRHFMDDCGWLKREKNQVVEEMQTFFTRVLEDKQEIKEYIETESTKTTASKNKKIIADYYSYVEELRADYEKFKEDIEQDLQFIGESLNKVQGSVAKMEKKQKIKYDEMQTAANTINKQLKKLEGINIEITAIQKRIEKFESTLQQ